MKRCINLTKWMMCIANGYLVLSGIADEHPTLGKNVMLAHTSAVLSINTDENHAIICETRNSSYRCDWKFVSLNPESILKPVDQLNKEYGDDIKEIYKTYIRLVKHKHDVRVDPKLQVYYDLIAIGERELSNRKEVIDEKLIREAEKYENCIYLDVSIISRGNVLAYNIDGISGVINPRVQSGHFVSTIVYETDEDSEVTVGLKYLVGGDSLDINSISDNVDTVVIHNSKVVPLIINGSIIIQSDDTEVIPVSKLLGEI